MEKYQGKSYLEELNVDGRIILKWILNTWAGVMNWIDMAQDMDMSLDVANAVMNLTVPQSVEKFLNSQGPLSLQEGFRSMKVMIQKG